MGRLFWPLAFLGTFVLGLAVGGLVVRKTAPSADDIERLQQRVETLQARLRTRENLAGRAAAAMISGDTAHGSPATDAPRSASLAGDQPALLSSSVPSAAPQSASGSSSSSRSAARAALASATVEQALERFYRYVELTKGSDGRERWREARDLVEDLRAMGSAGSNALMRILASSGDTEERRTAARMLGTLQVAQALPLLRDVIDKEDDLLLRRAAAYGLRQLQTADSIPVMERLLINPGEDRFIRLSAAAGLAQSGKPMGVLGLTQIFDESTSDGRGREMAFRALNGLGDERPLPFMRQLVVSQAEPGYRLQAIRYVSAQGDRQALPALQLIMNAPNEQQSIREAAAQAYATITAK